MEAGRIVILGAGFGGLLTALTLAKQNYSGEIVLVDARDHHTYSPWLYEVATGFLLAGGKREAVLMKRSAIFPIKEIIKPWPRLRFRQGKVVALEVHDQYVVLEDGNTLRYDQLVIALGSEPEFYNIPGLAEHCMALKSVDDALLVRDRVMALIDQTENGQKKMARVVIAGAGATGVETASELVNTIKHHCESLINCRGQVEVTLVEAGPTVLAPFPVSLQQWASARLLQLGVKLQTNSTITKVEANKIILKDAELPFDLCVWTGGVRPNSVFATWGLPKDARGRIQVDEYLRVAGLQNVFALGDGAAFIDPRTQKPAPGTAWVAMDQGKRLGDNLSRLSLGQSIRPFTLPKNYPAVLEIGGRFAVATIGGFNFKDQLAHLVRRVIDLNYFLAIFPFWRALKLWRQGTKIFEMND